jgi:sugar phosphate permease
MKIWKSVQKNNIEKLAWIMWVILAFSFSIGYFHRVSLAVILDYLIIDFNIKDAAVAGFLASMYSIIYMVMQIPSGLFADFWGPRKTVTTGILFASTGSFIFALAPNLVLAFVGRGLIGLGVSVILISIYKFQISWFKPSQFATMAGFTALAGNLGGAAATTPLVFLVLSLGWRNSFFITGVITLVIGILCWLLVRDSPQEVKNPGEIKKQVNKKENTIRHIELFTALKKVLKNPDTWPLFMSLFGVYGTLITFSGTWSISYLMQVYGLTRNESANFMLAVTIGMITGSPLIGYVSDKVARRKWPCLTFFALYITVWALLVFWNDGSPPAGALYPIFFLMGLSGSCAILIASLAKDVNEPAYSGTSTGVVNIGPFAGMTILQPLLGYILDLKWEGTMDMGARIYPLEAYRLTFTACLITLVICFGFALKIKETNCENIFQFDNGISSKGV